MLIVNSLPQHGSPLLPSDARCFDKSELANVAAFLASRHGDQPTPLLALPCLASKLGLRSIHMKDEGHRLGLGSFKALGGAYAVVRLVLAEAERRHGRSFAFSEMTGPEVRAVAESITVTCATDGNHGKSVAQGARLIGAKCVIFVHKGVSSDRVRQIAALGAEMVRVKGSYDDSVETASRTAAERGWLVVSDTSWEGYEAIPNLVMQGYTTILSEALRVLPDVTSHVFIQAGVGGIAAAVAGQLAMEFGSKRPYFVVVEPARAACLQASAKAGVLSRLEPGEPTVMAMLECYKPSLVAWRILSRVADAFMTVDEDEAIGVMRQLANPLGSDPAIAAGESGGVGLAGLMAVAASAELRVSTGLNENSSVFLINTEGATDRGLYESLVGTPARVET